MYCAVANTYGCPFVVLKDNKPLLCLDDWDGLEELPISREFYDAWVKEFGK